jgi:hypothetical protein
MNLFRIQNLAGGKMTKHIMLGATLAITLGSGAQALTVNAVDGNADDGASLVSTLLGASSGLTVTGTSFGGAAVQSGTYSGFNTVGLGALGDGITLSSGHIAQVPLSNTVSSWDHFDIGQSEPQSLSNGLSDDADLVALLQSKGNFQSVNDVNFLEFSFTVDDLTKNSVSASFAFGTEEYPDQSVTDIFAFFVDGVNYAFFPDGSLINFDEDGPSAGFYQSNLAGVFDIEWDGLTKILQVTGLLNTELEEHTIKIALADTSDTIFDSAVYIASLSAGNTDGGGGIGGPAPIPLPAGFPLLLGALGGLAFLRRRSAK